VFVVDPTGGPQVNVNSSTCFGSPTTGGPRPMATPSIKEEGTGVVTTLENGGPLALALASSYFRGARVQLTFQGDRTSTVTRVQFLSVTRVHTTYDATLGTLAVVNGAPVLQQDDGTTVSLSGAPKVLTRLANAANLHCGRTVLLGSRLAPNAFRVDTDVSFGEMFITRAN
jgi:hypothetical protein